MSFRRLPYVLRQRVCRAVDGPVGVPALGDPDVQSTWQAYKQCLYRIVQPQFPGRVPQPALVLVIAGGTGEDRGLEAGV